MIKPHENDLHPIFLHRLSTSVSSLINYCAWFVGISFGFFTLYSAILDGLASILTNDSLVWKLIISLYFASWLVGVKFDKSYEEYVYGTAPREGKLDTRSIILAASVFFLFFIIYSIDSLTTHVAITKDAKSLVEGYLGNGNAKDVINFVGDNNINLLKDFLSTYGRLIILVFINILWFFNIPLWRYFLRTFIIPMSVTAANKCKQEGNLIGLEKISVVDNYISGPWQTRRFIVGSIILICANIFWIISVMHNPNEAALRSIVVCGFLLFIEAWVWLMRARMKYAIQALDKLSEQYRLARLAFDDPSNLPNE